MIWKMRNAKAFGALDSASRFAPGPLIVMLRLMTSSSLVRRIVAGNSKSNTIVSPFWALPTACRNEPGPLSLVLMTVMVAALRGDCNCAKQAHANRAKTGSNHI